MYKSIELNREFESKNDLFAALKVNAKKIIAIKKSQIFKSIDKGQITGQQIITRQASKGLSTKNGFIYPVINTTDFLDSHLDNHQKGIWNKSAKEQSGKIRYSMDHSSKIADVVAWPEDVSIKLETIDWVDLGFDYIGKTQALIFEIETNSIDNTEALKIINKQRPVENSVCMQYVNIELAINSEDKEYRTEKKLWDSVINDVANKDFANETGYMWIVKEAKIINESSMVTKGSNSATTTIYEIDEPEKSTQTTIEPSDDTQLTSKEFINILKTELWN